MNSLLLKLVLTPLLIGVASLAGRRWGHGVSGWLVGLPFTSGPIAFFLALDYGPGFATRAALGIAAGTISQTGFALVYGWSAARGVALALLAACLAFGLATAALLPIMLPIPALALLIAGVLMLALALMPHPSRALTDDVQDSLPLPSWDLPARMVVATAFVLLLTSLASGLGPRLAGLLAPFPLYGTVLTVFAHKLQGPEAARGVLRGLLFGLFAFAAFFLVIATLLQQAGIGIAFAAAIVSALALQGCTLLLVRRPALT